MKVSEPKKKYIDPMRGLSKDLKRNQRKGQKGLIRRYGGKREY